MYNFSKHFAFSCIFLPIFSFIINFFLSRHNEVNLGKIWEKTIKSGLTSGDVMGPTSMPHNIIMNLNRYESDRGYPIISYSLPLYKLHYAN